MCHPVSPLLPSRLSRQTGDNSLDIRPDGSYRSHVMVSATRSSATRGQEPPVNTVYRPPRLDAIWAIPSIASLLRSAWTTAGIGVVILAVSMVLMAHSAPGRSAAPMGRAPAPQGSLHLQHEPGPVPGRYRGSELRPSR